ncbi:putative cdc123-like protein [Cotonvirus japonicus]|uniref:Cdc123-like protein n=1 Tax=Cotonvirus japonicus TaxID=2811091 RepID=A0ABM7NR80_9VIRU|nr:putative cdc123-like protein [Cotonvirus japonicus]BCS82654.1 putative cdc123-like protein [Cotonvirus japonicus]
MNCAPYIKISETNEFKIYLYPKNYLELFLDELFYKKSIGITDDFTFKMSDNGYIIDKFNNESDVDFEYLREAQISVYWISEWYPYIKDKKITFDTKFLHLTDNDIEDLWNFKMLNYIPEKIICDADKIINKMNGLCFVRSDAYSPKDLLFSGCVDNLKVTNGLTAIKLIVNSERCCTKLFSNDKILSRCIVFREYIEIDTNYEFRCFVYDWRLRAVCQSGFEYNPDLHSKRKLIYHSIIKFWDEFSRMCPYSECTMDIIYNDKLKDVTLNNSGIMIIEFNSFGEHMNASSGLYDWIHDDNLLTESTTPHFLLAEKPICCI